MSGLPVMQREQFNVSCMKSNMGSSLRREFLEHRSSIANQTFADNDARSYWNNAKICTKFPGLTRLARLILTVAALSIAQGRQLSELKRQS